jgi:hypothetical protein
MLAAMTRIEIDDLRLRCEAVLKAYTAHASNLLEHSKGGVRPLLATLHAEEQALYEFATVRRELLDALAAIYHAE